MLDKIEFNDLEIIIKDHKTANFMVDMVQDIVINGNFPNNEYFEIWSKQNNLNENQRLIMGTMVFPLYLSIGINNFFKKAKQGD